MQRHFEMKPFAGGPITLGWSIETPAERSEVWPYFADTDRWNRALGVDLTYELKTDPDGTVHSIGKTVMAAQTVYFDERTFDFELDRHFSIDRYFENGPFTLYTVRFRLEDLPEGGTRAWYTLAFTPRRGLEKPLATLGLYFDLRPRVERVLQAVLGQLSGDGGWIEASARQLPRRAEAKLHERLAKLSDAELGKRLGHFVRTAPEAEQDRMQARLLARRWKLDEGRTIDGLVEAVTAGVLEMRWELLCPSCTGPSASGASLDPSQLQAHCDSCNITYDASFADSVAVTFRPTPELRPLDVPVRCVGSPARTPHVVARAMVEPFGEAEWTVDLPPGGYRIRELGSLQGVHVEVRAGGERRLGFTVLGGAGGFEPQRLHRAPGVQTLRVWSRLPRSARLVVERRWRPEYVLTAGMLMERERARELLPGDVLPPALGATVRPAGVLVGEVFDPRDEQQEQLRSLLSDLAPESLRFTARGLVATWADLRGAVAAAERLQGAWQTCSAVGFGPVVAFGDGGDPSGSVVTEAEASLRSSLPGRTALPGPLVHEEPVRKLTAGASPPLALEPGPGLGGRSDVLLKYLQPGHGPRLPPADSLRPVDTGLEGLVFEGRYELKQVLGKGGFGTVYAAVTPEGEDVVVKVLKGELVTSPEEVEAFFVEARLGSRLRHPHVVRFLDFGHSSAGHLYLVMERLHGSVLDERLREALLSPRDAAEIGIAVAEGLHALHEAGLVHRDVKPANIFVGPNQREQTKVLDLGIAADPEEIARCNADAEARGTLGYIAPEQMAAEHHDGLADVYSLGLSLWECLSGKLPYRHMDPLAMAVTRATKGIPPLRQVAPLVPAPLAEVIDRACLTRRSERWGSAQAMAEALRIVLDAGLSSEAMRGDADLVDAPPLKM